MKYRKATKRNTAQLILNSFLCYFKLRTGSITVACVNIILYALGIWHSLHFARENSVHGTLDVGIVHYFWIGISMISLTVNIYLLISLIKNNWRAISIWVIWTGSVLILRFTVIVLMLTLNIGSEVHFSNVVFHILALFVTLYCLLVQLSYYQEVTLTSFGYYKRYRYPSKNFPLVMGTDDDCSGADEEYKKEQIKEEFV